MTRAIATGITKDTQLCMSLAARPGNTGTRFHNFLYDALGLDYVYKAFTCSDITAAIAGVRSLGVRGCAVSMPWKEDVIALVDEMTPSASAIESVNTIVNTDGHLVAYNTDYLAIVGLLTEHNVLPPLSVAVFGSGGMAKACAAALRDAGFTDGVVVARNQAAGEALASKYGYRRQADATGLQVGLVLNATPIGMAGGPDADALAVPREVVATAEVVFEVVAMPVETPLVQLGRELGKIVITGAEVMALQALEQFVLYTGVRPDPELAAQAREFSRAP